MTITAYIMARNEEKVIGECLDSLKWCNKIIVFDTGSTDTTKQIAKSRGAEVRDIQFIGFGPTRNKIINQIDSDWIVCFDADEICSPELAQEIQQTVQQEDKLVFKARRRNFLLGKEIKHSGWGKDFRHPVLFKKGAMKYDEAIVHEGAVTPHKIHKLKNTFEHHSFRNLSQLMDKEKSYAIIGSNKLRQKGYKSSFLKAFVHATGAFFRLYIAQRGFLDGFYGFVIANSNAHSTFYRYMMASENIAKENTDLNH